MCAVHLCMTIPRPFCTDPDPVRTLKKKNFTDPKPTIQNVRTVSGCGSSLFCELIVQFTVLY